MIVVAVLYDANPKICETRSCFNCENLIISLMVAREESVHKLLIGMDYGLICHDDHWPPAFAPPPVGSSILGHCIL